MKKINALNDLLFEQTINVHSSIKTILEDLPFIIERCSDPAIRSILKFHFDVFRVQEKRVRLAFNQFESGYQTGSSEVKEMLKNIFCRIGRSESSVVIDTIIVMGITQISAYMLETMTQSRDLAASLGHKHLSEYLEECMQTETKLQEKIREHEQVVF